MQNKKKQLNKEDVDSSCYGETISFLAFYGDTFEYGIIFK